jgi:biuret amidohydrolase
VNRIVQVNAAPMAFVCDLDTTALLIIDMQNDFCSKGGFLDARGVDISPCGRVIPPIHDVLTAARSISMTVIFTREGHRPDLSDCLPKMRQRMEADPGIVFGSETPLGRAVIRGEKGYEIVEELCPLPREIIVDKPGNSGFFASDLEFVLRNKRIESLIVAGLGTEVCLLSTVRDASERGLDCLVLEDCCASLESQQRHEAALLLLKMVKAQGVPYSWVSHSAELLRQLELCSSRVEAVHDDSEAGM